MDEHEVDSDSNLIPNVAAVFLAASLSAYALIRKGNYKAALLFYPSGGGGLNFYKINATGSRRRVFAVDYHSFWDKDLNQSVKRLHYHRGDTCKEKKMHRPYEGGW